MMAVIVISITAGHSLVSSDGFYNREAPLKMETIEDAGTNLKDCQVGQYIDEHDDDDDDEGDDDEVMAVVLFYRAPPCAHWGDKQPLVGMRIISLRNCQIAKLKTIIIDENTSTEFKLEDPSLPPIAYNTPSTSAT